MRRVALVSCSETKKQTAAGETLPACELYAASDFFRMQLAEATARCGGDVFILSAEHCLVSLSQPLATYDRTMAQVDAAAWANKVLAQLASWYPGAELELLVFAGGDYVAPLHPRLPEGWKLIDVMAGQTILERRKTLKEWRVAREGAPRVLELPALAVAQPGGTIYSFCVDGKQVQSFSTVSRVRRAAGALEGYQRLEALAHIRTIRAYLESGKALIPNAVVLAFDNRVTFEPTRPGVGPVQAGTIRIPLGEGEDWVPPGWVVDGQQRLAAVRDAEVEAFPLMVSAFVAGPTEQAEHFIRVNSTKPLPKGLIFSLLPHTPRGLAPKLEAKRLPALLVELLNEHEASPLRGMIVTMTNPAGAARDTSFLGALEDSLSDGALYHLQEDMEAMQATLFAFWEAVRDTFPREWGKKPKECRLFHGAGIAALFFLMDSASDFLAHHEIRQPTAAHFKAELGRVKPDCRWMDGTWGFGVPWNKLQNTSQHKRELATFLTTLYRERSKGKRPKK